MICATIRKNIFLYNYRWLLNYRGESVREINKNLEKFRNFFSQNFEKLLVYLSAGSSVSTGEIRSGFWVIFLTTCRFMYIIIQ